MITDVCPKRSILRKQNFLKAIRYSISLFPILVQFWNESKIHSVKSTVSKKRLQLQTWSRFYYLLSRIIEIHIFAHGFVHLIRVAWRQIHCKAEAEITHVFHKSCMDGYTCPILCILSKSNGIEFYEHFANAWYLRYSSWNKIGTTIFVNFQNLPRSSFLLPDEHPCKIEYQIIHIHTNVMLLKAERVTDAHAQSICIPCVQGISIFRRWVLLVLFMGMPLT